MKLTNDMKEDIYLLHIETATDICSVSLSKNDELIANKELKGGNSHAQNLIVFINEMIEQSPIKKEDLKGVSVSMGPGSYTGLRIGVSTAKGICYALKLPLISVSTLESIAVGAMAEFSAQTDLLYCPMIDARRMEVFTTLVDGSLNTIEPIQAKVVEEDTFAELLKEKKVVFCGNGMPKCRPLLEKYPNAQFSEVDLSSKNMIHIAYQKFLKEEFEDVAYFEPFYLKQYIAQKSHVKGLE